MSVQSNEVTVAGAHPVGNIKEARIFFKQMTPEVMRSLPRGMDPDKFMALALTAVRKNPKLQRCTQQSFFNAILDAAHDGLMPDGKEGAIIPYGEDEDGRGKSEIAKWMPMIHGIRKLVQRSGKLTDWKGEIVHKGDKFQISKGDNPQIYHEPSLTGGAKRPILGCYSIARYPDGTLSREWMNIDEIEEIRSKSKAKKGPWSDPVFYPQMCLKTVMRRHAKQLPMSNDLEVMFQREDAEFALTDRPRVTPPAAPASVAAALDHFGKGEDVRVEDDDEPATEAVERAPAEKPPQDSPELIAWRRGAQAKANGMARKAIPGEYREAGREAECKAWELGHDGAALPLV